MGLVDGGGVVSYRTVQYSTVQVPSMILHMAKGWRVAEREELSTAKRNIHTRVITYSTVVHHIKSGEGKVRRRRDEGG